MITSRKLFLIGCAIAAFLLIPSVGYAMQDAAAAAHGGSRSWWDLLKTTGFVGILLVLVSIGGVTLVIEHFVNIKREKLAPPRLTSEIQALMDEGNYDEAIDLCDQNPCYASTVVGSALRMRHAGYEEMIGVLEQAAAEETFKLNSKISYLSLLGNVAPLLGLLGTVTGMISSFQVIEKLKAPTPKDLAVGVYESLVNTTLGLFLAIVFLTFFFVFKNKVTSLTLSVNLQAVDMLKHLAAQVTGHGGGTKVAR
jgi:biopolymer transport protein ExbB